MSKKMPKNKPISLFKRIVLVLLSLVCFVVAIGLMFQKQIKEAYNKFKNDKNISVQISELNGSDNPKDLLQVHFIDVGQGDATLITYKDYAMLIDGGDNSKGTVIQKYLIDLGVDKLDYVIGTHPDADHIGGLDVIIYKFDCETIMLPNVTKDTKSYEQVMDSIEGKGYEITYPEVGNEFYMGDVKFTILAPVTGREYEDVNDYSIVIKMEYGDISYVFAGDAGIITMNDIVNTGAKLDCDVYKVAHHGSADSYNVDFLNAMSPSYMIISCGKDNDYNHPHREIEEYISDNGIVSYRTDIDGHIVAYSDGEKIAWITE